MDRHLKSPGEAEELSPAETPRVASNDRSERALVAVQGALNRLAAQPEIGAFLEHVLLECTAQLGEWTAQLFLYDATTGKVRPSMGVLDGKVVPEPGLLTGTTIPQEILVDSTRAWRRLTEAQGRPICFHVERDAEFFWPGTIEFHRARGHRVSLCAMMMIGPRVLGMLGLACRDREVFEESELAVIQALTQQAALAVEMHRLTTREQETAIARERVETAQARAAQLQKTSDTLQETIDAGANLDRLEQLVPEVLRIVSRAFGTESSAYYEHADDSLVRLRYWHMHDRIFKPEELLDIGDPRYSHVRVLAEGFTVPVDYLGTSPTNRSRAVVINHRQGSVVPSFDVFACSLGWDLELNVPLVVAGRAAGALVLYRRAGQEFTAEEINLAETLGKQLALALQTNRLAEAQRTAELAREREAREAALESQRIEIAREIHDSLAQSFTGLLLQMEAAELLHERGDPRVNECWQKIRSLARFGLAEARRTALALAPSLLEDRGLLPVLSQLAQRSAIDGLLACTFEYQGLPRPLGAEAERCFVRIAKEALSNSTRHGRATAVAMRLSFDESAVTLEIADDGLGLNGSTAGRGLGLRSNRTALDALGGTLEIASRPEGGAVLTARLPWK